MRLFDSLRGYTLPTRIQISMTRRFHDKVIHIIKIPPSRDDDDDDIVGLLKNGCTFIDVHELYVGCCGCTAVGKLVGAICGCWCIMPCCWRLYADISTPLKITNMNWVQRTVPLQSWSHGQCFMTNAVTVCYVDPLKNNTSNCSYFMNFLLLIFYDLYLLLLILYAAIDIL